MMRNDEKLTVANLMLPEEIIYKTGTRQSSGRIRDGKFLYYIPKRLKEDAVHRVLSAIRPKLQQRLLAAMRHLDFFQQNPSRVNDVKGLEAMAQEIYQRKYSGINFSLTIKFRRQKTVMGTYRRDREGEVTVHINDYFKGAPIILLEYIIAHELSHHHCPGHDRAFYHELQCLCPDYSKKRNLANAYLLLKEAKFL